MILSDLLSQRRSALESQLGSAPSGAGSASLCVGVMAGSLAFGLMADQDEGLTVQFHPDDDGTGELAVTVRFAGFAGSSAAWFHEHELLTFTDRLAGFPLPDDGSLRIAGGYWSQSRQGDLDEEHVSLAVRPLGRRGQLGVTAHVSTPSDYDSLGIVHVAHVVIPTTYESLLRFASELRSMIEGKMQEARLSPEELL